MVTYETLEIGGRSVKLSSPDKELWPVLGITKLDVARYYLDVAEILLPHLAERPLVLHRCPEGMEGECFIQWRLPVGTPRWLARYHYQPQTEPGSVELAVVDHPASLAFLVGKGNLEFHPWQSTIARPDYPDYALFDLDPNPPADFSKAVEAALALRDLLREMGLVGYPKTSGGTGIHVCVPLDPIYRYEQVRNFVEEVGEQLAKRHRKLVTVQFGERAGKVMIDYSQVAKAKTLVAPYSLRARPGATVSTPLRWVELEQGIRDPMEFNLLNIRERLREQGDLFAPVLKGGQRLPEGGTR